MEKNNDTMTICTLARPDLMTISADEYKQYCHCQQHYELLIEMLEEAIELDDQGNPEIPYSNRDFLLKGFKLFEPKAFSYRVMQLKHDTRADGEED